MRADREQLGADLDDQDLLIADVPGKPPIDEIAAGNAQGQIGAAMLRFLGYCRLPLQ
jgi:hypothetical protein